MKQRLPRLNTAEESFLFQWRSLVRGFEVQQLPDLPVRNYRFHPVRRWELDFAWLPYRVGIEIQGGIWIGGAHARPMNIERDLEKHNALLDLGWRVWHFTPKQVKAGTACQHMERVILCARRGECVIPTADTAKPAPGRSGDLLAGCSLSQPPF